MGANYNCSLFSTGTKLSLSMKLSASSLSKKFFHLQLLIADSRLFIRVLFIDKVLRSIYTSKRDEMAGVKVRIDFEM